MIASLRKQVENNVPESGEFNRVYERSAYPDDSLCITDFVIRVEMVPVRLDTTNTKRNLVLDAYKLPCPYKSSIIISSGTKQEILNKLDEEGLAMYLAEKLKGLSHDLDEF